MTVIERLRAANHDADVVVRTANPAPVVVVSGLQCEAAALVGANRQLACGDAPTLERRLAELAASKPPLVISWGTCGGLDPRLQPGDLLIGDEVACGEERIRTDADVARALMRRLREAGGRVKTARFAAGGAPVLTAGEKAQLRDQTGAAAVDTESLIAGRFAREWGVPFAILRAVCDPAGRDLPRLAAKAVAPDGRIDFRAIFGDLARSPGQIGSVIWAARDSAAAFSSLRRCSGLLADLLLVLGLPDFVETLRDGVVESEDCRTLAVERNFRRHGAVDVDAAQGDC